MLRNSDQTVAAPRSRSRPATARPPVEPPPEAVQSSAPYQRQRPAIPSAEAGDNRLLQAAGPLLSLLAELRHTVSHPDVPGLQQQVRQEIRQFEETALASGCDGDQVTAARYILCSAIDEAVLATPWGAESAWSAESLLNTFHKETWGGEKVFQIQDQVLGNPRGNIELIEVLHAVLALGFKGRYAVIDDGRYKLDEIRNELYRAIRSARGDPNPELSPKWQGVGSGRTLRRYLPLWVVFSIGALVLLLVYIGFEATVLNAVEPIERDLRSLADQAPPPPANAPSAFSVGNPSGGR